LTAGEIKIDGETVDLRNIRSPIVVFASWGDNITPPQQALNWIPDLYNNVQEIRDNEQTIVYFLHEQIGHLGIFVSAGIANREHSEFASALDLIDVLPPGLYEAIIRDTTPDMPGLQGGDDRHVIRFEPRDVSDILALGNGREGERPFELVRHISEMNQKMYDKFVSPLVQMFSNETTATLMRNVNPARSDRLMFSDSNPLLKAMKPLAEIIRNNRKTVSPDNPLHQLEKQADAAIRKAFDSYRDTRDAGYERMFKALYTSPTLAAMTGFKSDASPRAKAYVHTPKQQEILRQLRAEHETWFDRGSPETGFLRLLIYIAIGNGVVDERPFNGIRRVMQEIGLDKTISLQQLKDTIKQQTFLVRMDEERALSSLTNLLPTMPERQRALNLAREMLSLSGPISEAKEARLQQAARALGVDAGAASSPAIKAISKSPPVKKPKTPVAQTPTKRAVAKAAPAKSARKPK